LNETATHPYPILQPDHPKSLGDANERARRRMLLDATHVLPLVSYGARLAERIGKAVPAVDPLDGGVAARLLILLETPGPKVLGTGFVSRDNPDGTAANMFRFLDRARIARADTVIWNIVPWLIQIPGERNRNPTRAEVAEGLAHLPDFLDLLPCLELAVVAGRKAETALGLLESRAILCLTMPHPSPTFVCTSPEVALRISACLGIAGERLALTRNSAPSMKALPKSILPYSDTGRRTGG
jgi:uracil-DNA glycosylase